MSGKVRFGIRRLFIVAASIVYAAAAAGAAQDAGMARCARLSVDTERLACFDALMKRQDDSGEPLQESEMETGVDAVERSSEPAAVEPAAVEPAAVQPAESTVQEDQPSRQLDEAPDSKRERPREYTAIVVGMRERPRGQMVVTLDNGETWSEQYASHSFLVNVGDTITMKSGKFSSAYRLVAPGGRAYRMTLFDE